MMSRYKIIHKNSFRLINTQISSLLKNKNLVKNKAFINGSWVESTLNASTFDVKNPANGELLAQVPKMKVDDAEKACFGAFNAWKTWKNTTPAMRSSLLYKMADLMVQNIDDLAKIITLEAGKPLAESKGEILYAASFYKFFAEEARRTYGTIIPSNVKGRSELVFKQSVGPAALITPWNFPSAMITRKVGAALAAGCTVVIKPSEETPLSALALAAIAEEAGIPAGVFNCITVDRSDISSIGNYLCHSENIRKISFTGSTAVGKILSRESTNTMKRVSMELGGNAPFIVFDDADIDVAIKALLASKFRNAGQTCISSNRILVQGKIYNEFSEKLTMRVKALNVGNGLIEGTLMGPLINNQGLNKVSRQVQDCKDKGGNILYGGFEIEALNSKGGSFYSPTVITNVTQQMLPAIEETFGPIAPLMKFDTEDEAVTIANGTRFGLAAYACTKDLARAFRLAESIETGMLGINEGAISQDSTPFGGIKESGLGREGSFMGIDEYLETKFVCMGHGSQ